MSIYKRKDTWWAEYFDAKGNRVRCSLKTKDQNAAQQLHDKLLSDRWRYKELGSKQRRTWKEAVVRWANEKHHKKSFKTDMVHLDLLRNYFNDLHLDEISRDLIDDFKTSRHKQGVSNSTINRALALIRSILRAAQHEWEWLDKIPTIKLLQEPPGRIRWLTADEITRLLAELPLHLRAMALFSLCTGLRESNVTQLKWEQIDLQRSCAWVNSSETKNNRAIAVPLNETAITVIREQLGNHIKYVFTYKGEPVTRANNHAWRKALKRAGIEDFRWHDLRHCWATSHIQNGTPENVLQTMGGWESREMVRRYAHLSADNLMEYADNSEKKLRLVE